METMASKADTVKTKARELTEQLPDEALLESLGLQ